jgi:hypothetical protein
LGNCAGNGLFFNRFDGFRLFDGVTASEEAGDKADKKADSAADKNVFSFHTILITSS